MLQFCVALGALAAHLAGQLRQARLEFALAVVGLAGGAEREIDTAGDSGAPLREIDVFYMPLDLPSFVTAPVQGTGQLCPGTEALQLGAVGKQSITGELPAQGRDRDRRVCAEAQFALCREREHVRATEAVAAVLAARAGLGAGPGAGGERPAKMAPVAVQIQPRSAGRKTDAALCLGTGAGGRMAQMKLRHGQHRGME